MKRVLQSRFFSSKPSRFPGAALSLEHVCRPPQREPTREYEDGDELEMGDGTQANGTSSSNARARFRSTQRISDPRTRAETRAFARAEFERNKNVTDLVSFPVHAITADRGLRDRGIFGI